MPAFNLARLLLEFRVIAAFTYLMAQRAGEALERFRSATTTTTSLTQATNPVEALDADTPPGNLEPGCPTIRS